MRLKHKLAFIAFILAFFNSPVLPAVARAEQLAGSAGCSSQWGSGWLDLNSPINFAKGERLRLSLSGTARRIFVRLLPKGASPDTNAGLIGGAVDVPRSRVVEITVPEERRQVIQISVHGGPLAWGLSLGGDNGPACLSSVERVAAK